MNLHEVLGIYVERAENSEAAFQREAATHRQTIRLLAQLKAGTLRLDQLEVDEANFSYQTFPDRVPPDTPPTPDDPPGNSPGE